MEVCLLAHFAATVMKKKGTGLQQQRPQRRPPRPAVGLVVAVVFMEVQVAQVLVVSVGGVATVVAVAVSRISVVVVLVPVSSPPTRKCYHCGYAESHRNAAYQWISRVTPLSLLMVSRTIDGASFIPK